MNLALEYFIRSGVAQSNFQTPCALYLNHLLHLNKKAIITIQWHPFSKTYLVKHWVMAPFYSEDILPNFEEYTIRTKNELFESDKVILFMHEPLKCDGYPYQAGINQRSTGVESREQKKEYEEIIESFFYPNAYKMKRLTWLWDIFVKTNKDITDDITAFDYIHEQMIVVMNEKRQAWLSWNAWCKFFMPATEIAPELVFHDAYLKKTKKWCPEINVKSPK